MLTGKELLDKVKECGDGSKSDLVRACGYVTTKKDGTERLNFTAFYEALLEAKGMGIGKSNSRKGAGRRITNTTRVHFNGNLMVGQAYTSQLGLKPGDTFEIHLDKKGIRLVPIGASDQED